MSEKKEATELTFGQRFAEMVAREFQTEIGSSADFTDYERALAAHLFTKVDQALTAAEAKRLKTKQKDRTPYEWANVNLKKLAVDGVHRIRLGLDALIPNHIWPIPYWNSKEKKYDLDLRIGYTGRDLIARTVAVDEVVDVTYELVYDSDSFKPLKRGMGREVETYQFEITKPFDRGGIVGGFGYIAYTEPRKNRLVLVTPRDFRIARDKAGNKDFWGPYEPEMMLKTIVHRTIKHVPIDPRKAAAASYAHVTAHDVDATEAEIEAEMLEDLEGEVLELPEHQEGEEIPETAEPEPAKAAEKKDNGNPELAF